MRCREADALAFDGVCPRPPDLVEVSAGGGLGDRDDLGVALGRRFITAPPDPQVARVFRGLLRL